MYLANLYQSNFLERVKHLHYIRTTYTEFSKWGIIFSGPKVLSRPLFNIWWFHSILSFLCMANRYQSNFLERVEHLHYIRTTYTDFSKWGIIFSGRKVLSQPLFHKWWFHGLSLIHI